MAPVLRLGGLWGALEQQGVKGEAAYGLELRASQMVVPQQ